MPWTVKSSLTLNQRNKKMLNLSYIKQVFCLNECGEIDRFWLVLSRVGLEGFGGAPPPKLPFSTFLPLIFSVSYTVIFKEITVDYIFFWWIKNLLSQGAKKIIFTACPKGKLKLAFTSPDVISTSPQNFCYSNSSQNITCPSGKLKTEFTSR